MKCVTNAVTEISVFSHSFNNSSNVKDAKIILIEWTARKVVGPNHMATDNFKCYL